MSLPMRVSAQLVSLSCWSVSSTSSYLSAFDKEHRKRRYEEMSLAFPQLGIGPPGGVTRGGRDHGQYGETGHYGVAGVESRQYACARACVRKPNQMIVSPFAQKKEHVPRSRQVFLVERYCLGINRHYRNVTTATRGKKPTEKQTQNKFPSAGHAFSLRTKTASTPPFPMSV